MKEILVTLIRDSEGNKKGFGITEFVQGRKTWESGFLTTDQREAEKEAKNLREYQKSLDEYGKLAFGI